MKQLLVLLLSILVIGTTNAGNVSEKEALKKAQHFMQGKQFKAANSSRVKHRSASNDAFYVFNSEDNDGFVIVSSDDRTPDILGYSMHGKLDIDNLPCNVSWLLNCYKQVLDSLAMMPDSDLGRKANRRSPSSPKAEIEPLITTHWGQGAPYNNQCPEYNSQKCLTGCVATAMAQIINYHHWPQGNTSTVDSYTTSSLGIEVPQLGATSFNWNNMTDDEVAKLMRYCGQAVHMDYTLGASGAIDPSDAFINVFGYSKSTKRWGGKKFSATELEDLVYKELTDGRPVFYTGSNSSGGHAFVVDGYNDGCFHINWGWNGDQDGYFILTGLTEDVMPYPFSYNTELTIGIQPQAQSAELSPVIADLCNFIPRSAYRNNSSESFIQQLSFSSNLLSDFDGTTYQIGYGLYNENGSLVKVLGYETATFPLSQSYHLYMTWGADVPIGDYLIIPIYRHNESEDWKKDEGTNTYHIIAHVNEKNITFDIPREDDNGGYYEYGVYDINGITYKLYEEYTNKWAMVLPYQITGKYSGNIVIPNKVEAESKTFIVLGGEFSPFDGCDGLLSITSSAEAGIDIYNCPNLAEVTLLQGNSVQIGNCNLLENLVFPITMDYAGIQNCAKLKTIRFNCKAIDLRRQSLIHWDSNSLPLLTDIYFTTPYPPGFSQDEGTAIESNNNVTIHVPQGSRDRYLAAGSAWKNWNIQADEPATEFITWGYCHNDAISSHGMAFGSADNDTEIAMKVPAEELNVYKGSKITHIQVYSPGRSINDHGYEDFEYVFITKQGTDYLVKQAFNVMRGTWNTIELETPYTITGEELYVGIGRHGQIGARFSNDDDTFVLTWLRAMGNDNNAEAHIGEWVYGCPKDLAHPLPLRFAIGGDNVPEGVAIGELKVTSGSNPVRRRSPGDTTIQGLIRNRSKQTVTSYSVAYSVDGGAAQTKGFVTDLAPNETETIEITLNGISTGEHTIKMDVVEVNSGANVLSNQNSPSMIVNEGAQLEYVNVSISSIGKLAYSSRYALDFSDVEGLKAYTVTGYDNDSKTIWMTRVNNAPAETGVMLKGDEGTYEIPIKATSTSAYKNYLKAIVDGGTVNQTEGDLTNYYLAGSGDNGPGLYQVDGSVNLGANRSYLQLPTTLSTTGSIGTEDITISSIGRLAYSSNNSLDFTSVTGLKAYAVTGYNKATGTIWLSRVNKVPAQTGVYLKGDPGNYTVPTLPLSGCYSNMLKSCVTSSTIYPNEGDLINYYLAGSGTNGPGFYPVEGSVTLSNNRSYLQIPTTVGISTRSADINWPTYDNVNIDAQVEAMPLYGIKENGATGIVKIKNDTMSEEVFYNLNGQKTYSPSKGVYIKNNKKVIVW